LQPGTWPQVQQILAGRKNPNGCPVPATWFVSINYTDPMYITQWFAQGNEVADHTITHDSPFCATYHEVEGNRGWMNSYAGIPFKEIRGFRHPFLNYSVESVNMLAKMGFTYETSQSAMQEDNVWPYTLDYGAVTDCTGQTTICGKQLNAKGLWEIPMYSVKDTTGGLSFLMDPYNEPVITAPEPPASVTSNYETTFDTMHYNTNRAPFGVYTHPTWLGAAQPPSIPDGAAKLKAVTDFLDYALAKPAKDVWMVTNWQLIQYMQNPVPASQLAAQPYMSCTPAVAPPTNICNGLASSATLMDTCDLLSGTQHTCYGCPSDISTLANPIPPRAATAARHPLPTNCHPLWWDPVAGKCLCTSPSCAYQDTGRPFNYNEAWLTQTANTTNSTNTASTTQSATAAAPSATGAGKSSNSGIRSIAAGEIVGAVVAAAALALA
ncbi:hypothetical protein BDK51DRAFT_24795, partial [Blyttiomyces helicus]